MAVVVMVAAAEKVEAAAMAADAAVPTPVATAAAKAALRSAPVAPWE